MTGGTVLVVDDDLDVVTVLAEALLDADYAYLRAVTAHEALQSAFDALPAAIVLDLNMPGMDGAELSRRLRASTGPR